MRNIYSFWVPPTKEEILDDIKHYEKKLKQLDDPKYVKKIIAEMKEQLKNNIVVCKADLKKLESIGE